MIHLHQLIENFEALAEPGVVERQTREMLGRASSAICFDMGELADLRRIADASVLPWQRMPFERCWFEYQPQANAVSGLLVERQNDCLQIATFNRAPARKRWDFCGWVVLPDEGLGTPPSVKETASYVVNTGELGLPRLLSILCAQGLEATQTFLAVLGCQNVEKVEHRPDVALAKARAKKGKPPLFSYWTLVLRGKNERGEYMGGTHASPRAHLRRGHIREYAPGKTTWVQASVVGNKALGMVHKDYRFEPPRVGA